MPIVYYLAQAYSRNPELAIRNAFTWVRQLRKMGLIVFSPIMHTHHYHLASEYLGDDYVLWDLRILQAFGQNAVMLMAYDAYSLDEQKKIHWLSLGCQKEYEWAFHHSIRILQLEPFLEGKEVAL
jgi:hypothetical protein